MFLKQERHEMDDFERGRKIGSKGNILFQYFKKILGKKFKIHETMVIIFFFSVKHLNLRTPG